jgi:hypothetical protein
VCVRVCVRACVCINISVCVGGVVELISADQTRGKKTRRDDRGPPHLP